MAQGCARRQGFLTWNFKKFDAALYRQKNAPRQVCIHKQRGSRIGRPRIYRRTRIRAPAQCRVKRRREKEWSVMQRGKTEPPPH